LNLNDHLSNKSILLIIIRLAKPVYPEKCCLSFTCPGVQDHTTPQAHTSLSQTLWALYIFGIFCILIFNEEYQNAITTVYTMVNGALLSTSASYDLFFGICIHSDSMYYWILMKIKGVAEESWSGNKRRRRKPDSKAPFEKEMDEHLDLSADVSGDGEFREGRCQTLSMFQ
jgi:hypothetical protein